MPQPRAFAIAVNNVTPIQYAFTNMLWSTMATLLKVLLLGSRLRDYDHPA
jgi:hypothetical protein